MTNSLRIRSIALVVLLALGAGCAAPAGRPNPSALSDQEKQLDEFARLRTEREQALAAMSVADLAGALAQDSERGREPWNSLALKEVQRRGAEVAPGLAEFVRERNRSAFLTLMGIRAVNRDVYASLGPELRVGVLIDTLAKAQYFNVFGLPHLYWEDPARAIIDEGPAAEKELLLLLDDQRPAPMWGEEQVLEFEAYQYRVADYALALIRAIRGVEEPLPQDPAARDDLIRQLTP